MAMAARRQNRPLRLGDKQPKVSQFGRPGRIGASPSPAEAKERARRAASAASPNGPASPPASPPHRATVGARPSPQQARRQPSSPSLSSQPSVSGSGRSGHAPRHGRGSLRGPVHLKLVKVKPFIWISLILSWIDVGSDVVYVLTQEIVSDTVLFLLWAFVFIQAVPLLLLALPMWWSYASFNIVFPDPDKRCPTHVIWLLLDVILYIVRFVLFVCVIVLMVLTKALLLRGLMEAILYFLLRNHWDYVGVIQPEWYSRHVLLEACLESIPQLLLQAYNTSQNDQLTIISIVSFSASAIVILNIFWKAASHCFERSECTLNFLADEFERNEFERRVSVADVLTPSQCSSRRFDMDQKHGSDIELSVSPPAPAPLGHVHEPPSQVNLVATPPPLRRAVSSKVSDIIQANLQALIPASVMCFCCLVLVTFVAAATFLALYLAFDYDSDDLPT
jgi:hypothetical protein